MNENKNICPCCGKGCDLSAPRCPRGEEYARTGVIPPRGEGHGNHEHKEHKHDERSHREHGFHGKHADGKGNRFSHYAEMDTSDKILAQMSKLTHQSHTIFGGRGGQKRVLHILSKAGTMTQRELTERLDIQPGSASEIIKKLECAGYISRSANEADRRTADISLTDAGKAQIGELDAERRTRRDQLFSALTAEEAQQLLSLLEKLGADWDSLCKESAHHPHCHHHKEG